MVGFSPLSGVWSLGDVRNKAGETAAMTAARSNAHRFLQRASGLGRVDYDATNGKGEHVLNIAMDHYSIQAVRVLLAEGPANLINKQDRNGETVVMYAVEAAVTASGDPQLVVDLMRSGVDMNLAARNGVSARAKLMNPSCQSLQHRISTLFSLKSSKSEIFCHSL